MGAGKEKCEVLSHIRKDVAEKYGLEYTPSECTHQGDCSGTCPKCDAELKELQRQLELRGITDIALTNITIEPIVDDDIHSFEGDVAEPSDDEFVHVTMGMPASPYAYKERRRVLYKECQIAGITFHDLRDVWDELYEGTELALIREKDNKQINMQSLWLWQMIMMATLMISTLTIF